MLEFLDRRHAEFSGAEPEELEVLRFVKSWHRFPAFHSAIWYRGLNLGELDEYVMVSPGLKALLRQSGRMPR